MKNLVKTKVIIIIDKANIYVLAVQLFTNCKAFTFSSKKKKKKNCEASTNYQKNKLIVNHLWQYCNTKLNIKLIYQKMRSPCP